MVVLGPPVQSDDDDLGPPLPRRGRVGQDLREPPLGHAPVELDLQMPVLRDEVPLDPHRVLEARRVDVRPPVRVAHDVHRRREVRDLDPIGHR